MNEIPSTRREFALRYRLIRVRAERLIDEWATNEDADRRSEIEAELAVLRAAHSNLLEEYLLSEIERERRGPLLRRMIERLRRR